MIPILFFLSGFTALVYQVLWLKELGLLFGNTAHAASVGLTVFFLGLAVGGWFWGARAPRVSRPLRGYALLEGGVALSAVLYFWLLDLYHWLYTPMYDALAERFVLLVTAKSLLALGVLFPAAFFMGGTFPLMGQHVVRAPGQLGRAGTFLYGINTAGAALGAFVAGFYLPASLGFRGAYLLAIALTLAIAGVAWAVGRDVPARGGSERKGPAVSRPPRRRAPRPAPVVLMPHGLVALLAAASGALTLGLEVAWIRMFAQVLANSVYTYSTILVTFLVALALGSAVANRLCRLEVPPQRVLAALLPAAGLAAALTPWLFVQVTGGLSHLGGGDTWSQYVTSIFTGAAIVLLVPGVLLGAVFPYMLRAVQNRELAPGTLIGRLVALNTSGAIVGAVAAGFLLLGTLGLWGTIYLLAAGYFALALAVADNTLARPRFVRAAAAVCLVAVALAAGIGRLPLVHLDAAAGERLVETWEGHHGVVAVVEQAGGLRLKLNNFYALGGTVDEIEHEQIQALLPLVLHPDPRSVFFLGMGTGITAGEALRHPVERVVVVELIPEVVTAARTHFAGETNGLFDDPRVRILVEDGRSHLLGTSEAYDVIVADLFVPWHAGTGSLYTREHFRTARQRLRPDGFFVQWLPLFQLSEADFAVIARTMLAEFPRVVLWRADFYATKAVVALVGFEDAGAEFDGAGVARRLADLTLSQGLSDEAARAIVPPFYAGHLTAGAAVLGDGPLNTDNRPVIEYRAPLSEWREQRGDDPWFYSFELLAFFGRLLSAAPPETDPYLARLTSEEHEYVRAGLDYYRAIVNFTAGREDEAGLALEAFLSRMPAGIEVGGPFLGLEWVARGRQAR